MKQVYWVIEGMLGGRCGPALSPWKPGDLHRGGVRGIVSLDNEAVDEAALADAGIDHLPLYQPMMFLQDEEQRQGFLRALDPMIEFIDRKMSQKQPVIVHCFFGCDRTGVALAMYLMARGGLNPLEAVRFIRRGQPRALEAAGYLEAVQTYYDLLKGRTPAS
jgi:protein-tyrosine phosphatase